MDRQSLAPGHEGDDLLRQRAAALYEEKEYFREESLAALDRQRELEGQVNELLRLTQELRRENDALTHAFWWRATGPLRALSDTLKRWRRRGRTKDRPAENRVRQDGAERVAIFTAAELAAQRAAGAAQKISLLVRIDRAPESQLRELIESVQAQTYANWELCLIDGSGESHSAAERLCRAYAAGDGRIRCCRLEERRDAPANAALEMATGEYLSFLDHDGLLHPAALFLTAEAIREQGAELVYTDEAVFSRAPQDAWRVERKPGFAPDDLRGRNYIGHLTARRTLAERAGAPRGAYEGGVDHDLALRLTEQAREIVHIPQILYYRRADPSGAAVAPGAQEAGRRAVAAQLARLGWAGEVLDTDLPGVYRTAYALRGEPLVSILIPNQEHTEDLSCCLESLFARTSYASFEVILIENGSLSERIFRYYEIAQKKWERLRVVTWEGPFNYSAINNFGAGFARGEYLLLLNNDTEIITPGWIEELLMFAQRQDVGAAGAKLYYPDDTVQHGGMSVSRAFPNRHLGRGEQRDAPGELYRLRYVREVDAVTGSCLLLRRALWEELGGLDETFEVAFNDVDLCMRLRQKGYRILWTPFAELYHYESKSRGREETPAGKKRFENERHRFLLRWGESLREDEEE